MERVSNASMRQTLPKFRAPSCYRLPWHDNTPVPAAFGCGLMIYTHVLNRGRMAVRSLLDSRGCPGYVPSFFEP
jgi:hypothetical protein